MAYFDDESVSLEARWGNYNDGTSMHQEFVDYGNAYVNDALTELELRIMKRGAVYPDNTKYSHTVGDNTAGKTVYPIYWHGQYTKRNASNKLVNVNYIACYNFMIRIAEKGGDITASNTLVEKVTNPNSKYYLPGITAKEAEIMRAKFKKTVDDDGNESYFIKGFDAQFIPYDKAMNWTFHYKYDNGIVTGLADEGCDEPGYFRFVNNYPSTSEEFSDQDLRKCFLYGLALHEVTDTFAHSSFKLVGNKYIKYNSHNADQPDIQPKRWQDARAAAQRTVKNYNDNKGAAYDEKVYIGIQAFSPAKANRGASEGYYLANVKKYALQANNDQYSDTTIHNWFKYIDFDYNNSEVGQEH